MGWTGCGWVGYVRWFYRLDDVNSGIWTVFGGESFAGFVIVGNYVHAPNTPPADVTFILVGLVIVVSLHNNIPPIHQNDKPHPIENRSVPSILPIVVTTTQQRQHGRHVGPLSESQHSLEGTTVSRRSVPMIGEGPPPA